MKRRARTLGVLAAFAVVATTVATVACDESSGLPIGTLGRRTIADSADQVVFGSRTTITDRGLLRAEIHSDTAYFLNENTRVDMRTVQGVFFNSAGAKQAALTSRTGRYELRMGTLEARGEVVMTSVDGRRLTSPFLRFDQRMNQISSDTSFVLTTEAGREMRGIGFRADPDLNNIVVLRVVSAKGGAVQVPNR